MYRCECGKEFEQANNFNGHKSHCIVHQKLKGKEKEYLRRKQHYIDLLQKHNTKLRNQALLLKQEESNKIRVCKKCNKEYCWNNSDIHSEVFCSRKCSNSHIQTKEQNEKRKQKLINQNHKRKNKNIENYNLNPNFCIVCGKKIDYKHRYNKTCCKQCNNKHQSIVNSKWVQYHNGKIKNQLGNYIVYKVICLIDNSYYIGVHRIIEGKKDNYLGSGKIIKAKVKKYSKENFKRETLKEFNNSIDAYDYEYELVSKNINNKNCLNLSFGGIGGSNFLGKHHSEETKEKLRHKKN